MSKVKCYTNLEMKSGNVNLSNFSEVPENPKVGNMCTIGGVIHFYTSIDGSDPFWMPISSQRHTYKHVQADPATEWTVNHDLNTEDIQVTCYDDDNNLMYAKPVFLNTDSLKIIFSEAVAGKAMVIGGSSKFSGFSPNAESLTSDTVTYGEGEPGDLDSGSIYFQV